MNHSNFSKSKLIDIVGVWGGSGPTITVAWGLTTPKSGPAVTPIALKSKHVLLSIWLDIDAKLKSGFSFIHLN